MKKLRVTASIAALLISVTGAAIGLGQAFAAPASGPEPQACQACALCPKAGGLYIDGRTGLCYCCQVE